jgi:hypothetical protein
MKSENRQKVYEILLRRKPFLATLFSETTNILKISHSVRKKIALALNDEFLQFGRQKDDEPNKYGLELEDLIGECKLTEE